MYKDYKSYNDKWYTIRPLPLFKREELSKRFNYFNKLKKISVQVLEEDDKEYNLRMILELYNLSLDDFELEEIDNLIINYILAVNYNSTELKKPSLESILKELAKEEFNKDESDLISKLFASVWGICNNAGDAIYMLEKIPAEMLMNTIKHRSEDLEKIYSTPEEKQKKIQKSLKEELLKKAKYENK